MDHTLLPFKIYSKRLIVGVSVELLWAMIACLGFLFINEQSISKKLKAKLDHENRMKYVTSAIIQQRMDDFDNIDSEIQRLQRANKKHEGQTTRQEEEGANGLGR